PSTTTTNEAPRNRHAERLFFLAVLTGARRAGRQGGARSAGDVAPRASIVWPAGVQLSKQALVRGSAVPTNSTVARQGRTRMESVVACAALRNTAPRSILRSCTLRYRHGC